MTLQLSVLAVSATSFCAQLKGGSTGAMNMVGAMSCAPWERVRMEVLRKRVEKEAEYEAERPSIRHECNLANASNACVLRDWERGMENHTRRSSTRNSSEFSTIAAKRRTNFGRLEFRTRQVRRAPESRPTKAGVGREFRTQRRRSRPTEIRTVDRWETQRRRSTKRNKTQQQNRFSKNS